MMKFNYEIKDKSLVTDEEYEQLEYLRLKEGYIWPAFNNRPGYVVIAKKGDLIVGWGFIFKKRVDSTYKVFYVYVKKDYRRNSIGSQIYKIAFLFNNEQEFYVSKWNTASTKFYNKLDN